MASENDSERTSSFNISDNVTNTAEFVNKDSMNILLINARSLGPKMYSLIDTMHEMDTSISLITETWLTTQSNQQLTDMRDALGYECIRQDRGSRGGGVAIIYKTGDLHMQQIKTGTKNEIVAALGRRTGQRRKTVAIAAYLPPNLDAEKSDEVLQEIVNLIGTFKRRYNAPYFIIGGDFNKRNIKKELKVYPDLTLVDTPPTRGPNTLDLVFTNFPEYVTKAGVTEAIANLEGTQADHLTVYVNAKMPRVPTYTTQKYTYLKQTPEGDEKMKDYLRKTDWQSCTQGLTPNEKVEKLHHVINIGMEECYERKTSIKKSSEPPWITSAIRRMIKRRRAVFRKWGRNQVWKQLKKKTRKIIRERRREE